MTTKYLDSSGLAYFWGKLKDKFQDKLVSGTNIKTINSESLLGSGNIDIQGGGDSKNIWYATCPTVESTEEKIVTTDTNDFVLEEGNMIRILFTYGNSNSKATLNIDGTGAKRVSNVKSVNLYSKYCWQAGEAVDVVYDGNEFVLSNKKFATTTYYGITKLSTSTSSTSIASAATPSAVKSAYDLAADATEIPTREKKSKFDTDGHMNSTDMDAQAVSDFVDGLNVQGGDNEIQTRKLLHTNTTSPFNAQTISLDLTDYDYVEVWFMQGGTSDGLLPNPLQVPIGEFRSIMNVHALLTSGVNENTGGRLVTASTTGITFGNYAYKNRRSGGTLTTANNFAVPHYIYGIKYL